MRNKTIFKWTMIALVLTLIIGFFVTSLCLASANGHSVVEEWQSWFGIVKENVDNVVETTKLMTMNPIM